MTISAFEFADSVGVNVHAYSQPLVEAIPSQVVPAMQQLGIRHARSWILPPQDFRHQLSWDMATAMYAAGIRVCSALPPTSVLAKQNPIGFAYKPEDVFALLTNGTFQPDLVTMWEGDNEPPPTEFPVLGPWYGQIATALAKYPTLSQILVSPAIGSLADCKAFHTACGAFPPKYADSHPYTSNASPVVVNGLQFERAKADALTGQPCRPMYASEFGFSVGPKGTPQNTWPGMLDADVAAEYTLRSLVIHRVCEIPRSYVYQLHDIAPSGTSGEAYFGLYGYDGQGNPWTPRPAAIAIRNMMDVLGNPTAPVSTVAITPAVHGFVPGPADPVSGRGDEIHVLPVVKDARTTQLWVSRTACLWNTATYQPIIVAPQRLVLDKLGLPPFSSARIYAPRQWATVYEPLPLDKSGSVPFSLAGDTVCIEVLA